MKDMIAICPSCHADVHDRGLALSDERIREWKAIVRGASRTCFIYVEPGKPCTLRLGTILFRSKPKTPLQATIFEPSPGVRLMFRAAAGKFMQLNLKISDPSGEGLLDIADGHIEYHASSPAVFTCTTTRCCLTVPAATEYIPAWVLDAVHSHPHPITDVIRKEKGREVVDLIDLQARGPGYLQVRGVFAGPDRAIVINRGFLFTSAEGGLVGWAGYNESRGDGAAQIDKLPTVEFEEPLTGGLLDQWCRAVGDPAGRG